MNKKQELSQITDNLSHETTPVNISTLLSPQNNLFATLLALGHPLIDAFAQSIHRFNPKFQNANPTYKLQAAKEYLKKNPKIKQTELEYKQNFINQYTATLHISKAKIIYEIDKLSQIATTEGDLKTALECLKTIGTELGMFQKNLTVQHNISHNNNNIIELIQANTPSIEA